MKQLLWNPESWRRQFRRRRDHLALPLTFLVLLFQNDLHGGATSPLGFEAPGDELQRGTEHGGCGGSRWLSVHCFPQALVL